jgi:Helicase conserved C-terminal domain
MESDPAEGAAAVRAALARYDDALLRTVTARLFKPRSHWPADELIDRAVENLANPPVIDRRLKELPPACRNVLAAVGLSRHYEWPVGQLLALLATLGHSEGLAPIHALLDAGLAVPVASADGKPFRQWEDWLGAAPTTARLFVPPAVAERAARDGCGLPELPGKRFDPNVVHAADGLEWVLRLGVLWQQLRATPIRLTQANALFKRDLTRLQADPLLAAPLPHPAVEVPEAGVLALSMGMATGLFPVRDGTLTAGPFPAAWDAGLVPAIADLWAALPDTTHWDPRRGYFLAEGGEPFPTVALPALLLLAAQPEGVWTHPLDVAEYLFPKHPSWAAVVGDEEAGESWLEVMFLGWAAHLRLVEAAQDGEGWWVRLTGLGRHLLAGRPAPDLGHPFPRCLVVQPNGDVVAYRQGLTAGLVGKLSRFADWKMIGPACTLGLSAESVYRGLESGLTLGDISAVLHQHNAHPVPANVLDLVRHWAGKRDRITVHTAATLLEFTTPADLEAAVARGLVTEKLTDRMGVAHGEIDYKHFRLLGNRDYEAKPQRCDVHGGRGRLRLAARSRAGAPGRAGARGRPGAALPDHPGHGPLGPGPGDNPGRGGGVERQPLRRPAVGERPPAVRRRRRGGRGAAAAAGLDVAVRGGRGRGLSVARDRRPAGRPARPDRGLGPGRERGRTPRAPRRDRGRSPAGVAAVNCPRSSPSAAWPGPARPSVPAPGPSTGRSPRRTAKTPGSRSRCSPRSTRSG